MGLISDAADCWVSGLDRPFIKWCYLGTVNLFKQLFSRHREGQSPASNVANWPGQSGKGYSYTIYPINTTLRASPGNFIYARQAEDGSWVPIYIAQTRNLQQRLEGHVSAADAMAHGATHLHAHYDTVRVISLTPRK